MTRSCLHIRFRPLITSLRKSFRKHNVDLIINTRHVSSLGSNEFYVNAYYDQESDKHNECAIEVFVYHRFDKDSVFEHAQLGKFLVQIYDAVTHEFKHQSQARCRRFKSTKHFDESDVAAYLSDPDEVDAYAFSIAVELIRSLGCTRAISYLHMVSKLAVIKPSGALASPALFQYFNTFTTVDEPVIRKLLKKVFLNLQVLDKSAIFY